MALDIMKKLISFLRGKPATDTSSFKPPGPIADLQMELTELALKVAREFGRRLDFSSDSIRLVESILAALHEEFEKTQSEEGLNGIALEFGAYIATTIQRNTGDGVLERDHPEFGEASFPFHFAGGTIFPYGWCMKRIFDGPADDVWAKYQALVLEQRT